MGGRTENDPLQGLCQGNGAAPACWIMVSLLMMSVYCREGHISILTSSITGQTIEFMGEIYVNNMDLLTIVDGEHDKNRMMQRAQANLDKWAHL
jgi:hypothetical protein